jgi:hypothetical protein
MDPEMDQATKQLPPIRSVLVRSKLKVCEEPHASTRGGEQAMVEMSCHE